MGEVFRAFDPRLKREVAIKVLHGDASGDPSRGQRLLVEAQAAGSLNHPNIVAVYDVGDDNGRPFIVSEFIHGRELRDEIDGGPIPTRRLLVLATQIAAGLRAAHEAGLLHRDLKPGNVMVTRDGRVKIVDFGLAKTFTADAPGAAPHDAATVTLPGTVVGTVQYMSPEQARGSDVDFRTDQFSFGLMLYEMATGTSPFRRDSHAQTMAAIIADEHRSIVELNPRVPVPLRWIIERCLAKEADNRYASTTDLHHDLVTVLNHLGEIGSAEPTAEKPLTSSRSRWLSAMVVVTLLAVATSVASWRRSDAPSLTYAPLVTELSFQGGPAWSPDGKTLAYVGASDGVLQVYTRNTASPLSQPQRITNSLFDCTDPFWSPDNTRIYYHSLARSLDGLWSISPAGGRPELVVEAASRATISPDGRTLAFFHEEDTPEALSGSSRTLWVSSPSGDDARAYTEPPFDKRTFVDGQLRFSPDGSKLLAWVWGWNEAGSNVPSPEFWMIPWPTGTPYKVLPSLARDAPVAASFDWLPDSRRIVVALWDQTTAGMHLWTADTVSGDSSRLTSTPGSENRPEVSPNGDIVAFTNETIDFDLVMVPLDGTPAQNLWTTSRNELDPTFLRDGSQYAYVSDAGGTLQIWLRSRDERFQRLVVSPDQFSGETTLALGAPALSPDGERIAYQRYAEKSGYQIWVSTITGAGPPVPLAPGSLYQDAPTWSPDGEWIAFAERTKEGESVLAKVRVGPGNAPQKILQNVITTSSRPKWSPDGKWILCDTVNGLTIVSPDGTDTRVISEDLWIAYAWAADGRRVLGLREADERARHYALTSVDIETKQERILNPDLGVIPPAAQSIRGLTTLGTTALVTSVASARSEIWTLEGFNRSPTLFERFWRR
jgi:serine/threonine protein kinase